MTYMVLGLIVFLGLHSIRIVADDLRTHAIERLGLNPWKGLYSIVSLLGFALIVWGFGQARQQPVQLWHPPNGMRHLAALLTLISFVLLAAAYVPGNRFKELVHHPMVLGAVLLALGHLGGQWHAGACWTVWLVPGLVAAGITAPHAGATPRSLHALPRPVQPAPPASRSPSVSACGLA